MFDAVRLTIQGRICTMDVMEVPDDTPILIGQLPLEQLDFVVDMRSHTLIGNPAHGGEHMFELLLSAYRIASPEPDEDRDQGQGIPN